MGAMAAQVGAAATALTSLTSIAGLQKGTSVLHHTLVSSLSDTSLKPAEPLTALSPPALEKSSKFVSPVRPAAMPPAATGPRLTPKPFSRETSADTFAGVKPPVTALKPSSVAPKSPTFAKTFGDAATPKGLTGNIPPLVDQKSIESRSTKDFVANMPFYSSPLANTVILFNTGNAEKASMRLAAERTFSTLQAQEGPVPSTVSEAPFRRPESAGIQRQLSLSSEPRSLSWNLHRSLEMKDTFSGATEERARNVEKDLRNSSINRVSEVQPRPKQRPVSAIFLESVKDPKQSTPDIPDEKSLPEKSWVRKPRPLSVDLTAKFENRDLSAQRRSCPPESKERPLTAHFADPLGSRPSEMGAKSEAAESSTADAPRSYLKSTVPVASSQSAKSDATTHIQTPSPNEAAPLGWNTPKDTGQVSAKDQKFLWERRLKGQDKGDDAEADSAGISEKSKGLPTSKAWGVKEKAVLSQRDTCTVSKDAASTSGPENTFSRGGSVKKPLSFLGTLTNGVAPGNADSRPESPGKEKKSMNIQQRIKELTAENTDGKPGHYRRSYASRPLSADLTKLFSSPVTAAEMKSEKKPDLNRMLLSDTQEVQENEPQLLRGADSSETQAAGSPEKPQQLSRAARAGGPLEKEGRLLKGREPVAPQGESPASVASHDARVHSTPPTAEKAAGIKTVRATLFEHSVQRHSVGVGLSGTELTSQPWKEAAGRPLGHRKEPWPEGESDAQATPKKVPFRQGDLSPDADKPWKRDSSNEENALKAAATCENFTAKGKYEKHTPQQIEDSLMYQRIEPRYEILQTVGGRVQSEAVTTVPEDEAMPLRSRRPLRRRTEGSATDAAWARSLDSKSGSRAQEGFAPEPKAVGEAAGKTASVEELHGSPGQHAFLRQVPTPDKAQAGQQQAPVKPPCLQSRTKNSETADDQGSKQPSEAEREKREAVLAGRLDSSRILKGFPENPVAAPGRTGGCEAGASTGQDAAVSTAGEPESRPWPCGASQWHKFSHRTSPPGADPARTHERGGVKAFGLKALPATHAAHEEPTVSDRRAEREPLQRPDADGWGRRSGTKASERWRRRTLPHDAIRFEGATEPARDSAKPLSRRDSLQLHHDFAARRGLRLRDGAEPRAGGFWGAASGPKSPLQDELCPSAPRATYFAVTCQIPDDCENAPGNVLEPTRSRHISALVEDARAAHGEPPLRSEAKPAGFGRLRQESECAGQTERGGRGPGGPRDKAAGGYRSRVLDIDVLMAEYREDARKASLLQGKREGRVSEDGCLASRERLTYSRTSTEKPPCEVSQRDSTKLDPSPGSGSRREVRAAEKPASCGLGRAPLRSSESAFGPPPWGRPAAEQPQRAPAEPASSRRKTFIIDEGEGEGLVLRHQTEKRARSSAHASSPGSVAVEPAAGAAPPAPPSQAHVDAAPWKGTSPRQRDAAWTWDGWCGTPNPSEVQKRRAGAHGGAREPGSCTAESGTERPAAAVPGPASALPELRDLYSGKTHQARARDTLASGLEANERRGQSRDGPDVPPERAEGRLSERSPSRHHCLPREGRKEDPGQEWAAEEQDGVGARRSLQAPVQQRSRSFCRDRRKDSWSTNQLRQCFGKPAAEARDTDTLVRDSMAPDSQYGTWSDQQHSRDSLVPESPSPESSAAPTRRQPSSSRLSSFSSQTDPASGADQQDSSRDQRSASLDCSSTDADSADGLHAPAGPPVDFSFLDQTPVLDSSALKTRVQLSKRRRQHRAPISHALRRSSGPGDKQRPHAPEEEVDSAWMFRDSTGGKLPQREGSDEEDGPRSPERSPACQRQRHPVFPGMDHSALKAHLRKRQDLEGTPGGHLTPLPKSPKAPLPAGGLPGSEKEERSEEPPPQWLRELQSRKRQSQCENPV